MGLLISLALLGLASVVVWSNPEGRARLLVSLLFAASVAWWWGAEYLTHQGLRIHTWEVFHHYLHAKYLPELRYRRMYQCVAEAAGEDRVIRDLVDNRYRTVSEITERDGSCRTKFSSERWEKFRSDIAWFKNEIGPERWAKVYFDHGANASPAWASVARFFVTEQGLSEQVVWRAGAIDTVLLAVMWVAVWSAFGPIAATVAAVLWATCALGGYTWTGGAFLRKDWLAAFAGSLVMLRRGWFLPAGILAGYSGMVRIFPLVILVAAALLHWALMPRERGSVLRFAAGAVVTITIGIALPVLIFDAGVWSEFASNLAKHRATNAGNVVGLPQILENILLCRYGPYGDAAGHCALPEQRAYEAADYFIAATRLLLVGGVLGITVVRFREQPLWLKSVVLLAALPFSLDAASYDMEIMALLGLSACVLRPAAAGVLLSGWALMNISAAVLRAAPGNTIWSVLGVELILSLMLWFVYGERRSDSTE